MYVEKVSRVEEAESMSEMWSVFGAWGVVENYMNYFEEGKVDEKDEYA